MLCLVVEASGDRYRLCDREVTAEFVLARLGDLPGCNEVGLLKILEGDCDDWVMQYLRVGRLHGLGQLRHRLSLNKDRSYSFQCDITVRLQCHSLVELG